MVTGMPMWTPEEYSTATIEWAQKNPDASLERGKILPWDDYWRHSRSLGVQELRAREHYDSIENLVVAYEGSRYYIGAAHFQFVAPKAVLSGLLPISSDRPMGQVRRLDTALNQAGFLRFSTSDWWVRHMGNTLEDSDPVGTSTPAEKAAQSIAQSFWKRKFPRRLAGWLYHKTFEIMYKE
jgi:hypothetical protein